jgi:hypothetical protein
VPENIIVGLGPADIFQVEEYTASYQGGKTLTFTEVSSPGLYGQPSKQLEEWVEFRVSLSAGEMVFRGKIKERVHVAENNKEGIRYTAYNSQALANEIEIQDARGLPRIYFTPLSTTTATTVIGLEAFGDLFHNFYDTAEITVNITTVTAQKLPDAISYLFTQMNSVLKNEGVPTAFSLDGVKQYPHHTSILNTVTLQGPFFAALADLCSLEPGLVPFFDDRQQQWKFVNVLESDEIEVTIDDDNVMGHNINWNTNNRYTAIELMAPVASRSGEPFENIGTYKFSTEVLPAWQIPLERNNIRYTSVSTGLVAVGDRAGWTRARGSTDVVTVTLSNYQDIQSYYRDPENFFGSLADLTPGTSFYNAYWHVFRTFFIPANVGKPVKGDAIIYFQKPETGTTSPGLLDAVECKIVEGPLAGVSRLFEGFSGGMFAIAKEPIVLRGNPDDPGMSVGVNQSGKPIFVEMDLRPVYSIIPNRNYDILRYPPVRGYEGTAFTMFGIKRVRRVEVDRKELTLANAQNMLRIYKDVIISGSIPIDGPPLIEFCELQAKVRLSHATNKTGLNSLSAIVTEYRHNFNDPIGTNFISFSTDVGGYIRNAR